MMAEDDQTVAARKIAKVIQDFRDEVNERFQKDFLDDLDKMDAEGFDPTRGRGRGPKWANGD